MKTVINSVAIFSSSSLEILTLTSYLLGGIAVFLVGMMMLSDSIQKSASKGIRTLFKKIGNNRWAATGIGAGVTAITQSSTSVTVMVIGLVNAGIITLVQACAMIMGANVGTTITGIMVSFGGFNIKYLFMLMGFVGAVFKIGFKNEKLRKIGEILIGIGVIFVGLEFMGKGFEKDGFIANIFQGLFEKIDNFILLIMVGAIFTAIVQSSSATTGIMILMMNSGVLPFRSAMYLVYGTNIGTCLTALIASLGANTNAKRAALFHLIFNVLGTIIFVVAILPFETAFLKFYEGLFSAEIQLAMFHILFNVLSTLILIFFLTPQVKLITWIIKDKENDPSVMKTYYIDERLLSTPTIAIEQTLKEIVALAKIAESNLNLAFNALIERKLDDKEVILREESRINYIYNELARFLVKISSLSISLKDERLLGSLHHVINDIERIGDHAENLLDTAVLMNEHNITFSEIAIGELKEMMTTVNEMFALSLEVFSTRKATKLPKVSDYEDKVDIMKTKLTDSHIERLNAGECAFESGEDFYAIITGLERVADHLTNIAFSIRSYTGSETQSFDKAKAVKKPPQAKAKQ